MADPDEMAQSQAQPTRAKPPVDAIDTRLVRRLADILSDTGLTEIEVVRGELKIRVARTAAPPAPMLAALAAPIAPQSFAAAEPAAPAAPASQVAPERRGDIVKSPMVGTVYLQAQPGAPPFVRVGDRVSEGQTLMIIEAMKTMNPIAAPRAGVLAEILAGDAQPVEFGEALAIIE